MVQTSFDVNSVGSVANGGNILDKAVLLSLSIHRFGISKKVKSGEVKSDAAPEMIKVSKKIFKSAAFENIVKRDGEFTRLLSDLALPSMFRAGVYAVPLPLLDRVDGEIDRFLEARALLITEFVRWYTAEIWDKLEANQPSESERLLGSLFEEENYLSPATVKAKFWVDYKYVSTSVPEKLKQIKADLFTRESQKAQAEIESMTENIKAVLRESVRDMLAHAVDKLKPKADGKEQIFRDSLVGNIRDFLATFQARNIADDTELAAVCEQIEGLLMGVTPDALRSDTNLRDEVRSTFEGITKTLDTMLVDRPARKLRRVENAEVA